MGYFFAPAGSAVDVSAIAFLIPVGRVSPAAIAPDEARSVLRDRLEELKMELFIWKNREFDIGHDGGRSLLGRESDAKLSSGPLISKPLDRKILPKNGESAVSHPPIFMS